MVSSHLSVQAVVHVPQVLQADLHTQSPAPTRAYMHSLVKVKFSILKLKLNLPNAVTIET